MADGYMFVDNDTGKQIDPSTLGVGSSSAPPMSLTRSEKADLLDKIKPSLIVEEIRQRLMGKDFIKGKWEAVEELQDRALTKKGAWDLANLMLPVSSQNVSISKLDDRTIRQRVAGICRTAQYMCLKNWKEYGILGTDQLYFVNEILYSNTLVTLKQPENAGIQNLLKGIIHEQRVTNENQSTRSKLGLFRLGMGSR